MTSKIKVDNINKVSDDTNIIKKCGSTTTVGSGSGQTIVIDGDTVTLGRCSGTVALASGATQTGFGRTGTVDWQTGSIKTTTFTAANGEGYFADTSSGGFTMNLPAGVVGNIVSVVDYTNTFQTHALTISPNGSEKIGGATGNASLNTQGQSVTLVYVDGTEGWKTVQDSTSNVQAASFVCASVSGACNTLVTAPDCANAKIATFVSPGTFTVNSASNTPANNVVSYMIVGGGGGGAYEGAAGAGGFREVKSPVTPYTASPLDGYGNPPNRVEVSATPYAVVVGGGGAGVTGPGGPNPNNPGDVSSFGGITSAGGGAAGNSGFAAGTGGSGGGGASAGGYQSGASGNTPPTSPAQGFPGGNYQASGSPTGNNVGGGGGGASEAGNTDGGGTGGDGVSTEITGSAVARAGGGGGGHDNPAAISGGTGGGGCGQNGNGNAGNTNSGGGGGGSWNNTGGNGGSGIVVIRYKFQ